MNKKVKIILISFLSVGLLIIGFFWYSYKTVPRDLLFNIKEILGESTNNPYEIRNDMYDFIMTNEVPKYKLNKEETTLMLNLAKHDAYVIKYFDDPEMAVKLYVHWNLVFDCADSISNLEKWLNDNYSDGDRSRSFYIQKFHTHKDSRLIKSLFYQHINNAKRKELRSNLTDQQKDAFCKKYSQKVFSLEDLTL